MEKELNKAISKFNAGEYDESIQLFDTILETDSTNADALFRRGIAYRKTDQPEKSINDFTAILDRLPDEATIYYERAISYFKMGKTELALTDMDQSVMLEPDKAFRYSSRAYIRASVDIDGAIEDYKKAIELDPNDEISYNNLGLLQEQKGWKKEAEKSFNQSNRILGYDPKSKQEPVIEKPNDQQSIFSIMLDVFRSKETRKEYFNFLSSSFKSKASKD